MLIRYRCLATTSCLPPGSPAGSPPPNENGFPSDSARAPPNQFCHKPPPARLKKLPILVILENRLAPVPAVHHLINRPGIFHSQWPRHETTLPPSTIIRQYQEQTPFMKHSDLERGRFLFS